MGARFVELKMSSSHSGAIGALSLPPFAVGGRRKGPSASPDGLGSRPRALEVGTWGAAAGGAPLATAT